MQWWWLHEVTTSCDFEYFSIWIVLKSAPSAPSFFPFLLPRPPHNSSLPQPYLSKNTFHKLLSFTLTHSSHTHITNTFFPKRTFHFTHWFAQTHNSFHANTVNFSACSCSTWSAALWLPGDWRRALGLRCCWSLAVLHGRASILLHMDHFLHNRRSTLCTGK